MEDTGFWLDEFPLSIVVTDAAGTILTMNARAREAFADEGGAALIGTSVFACHPEPSRAKAEALYRSRQPNHYTIRKGGRRKIIHQVPWYRGGGFAGFVELSIPIPDELPHFARDAQP
jgi:PAS domain-containing protein